MGFPYRARVNERWFLNLPGFHGGAYVVAYVEDTSDRGPQRRRYCREGDDDQLRNFEPRVILEIADCVNRINLEFELASEASRANSLHKVETLIAALRVFRAGLEQEFEHYDRRERELRESRD
jgi:hypothetical protein